MADQLAIAEFQHAFVEFRANFKEPIASFWYGARHGEMIAAMHKALSPWNLGLDNITWNQTAKNLNDAHLIFEVRSLMAGIQVGVGGVTMNAVNPDWARADQLTSLFQAAGDTLRTITGQEFQSQNITLGFHVKPGPKPSREILVQFVNAKKLGNEDTAKMFGVSAYYDDFAIVIDGSGVFPGSVFVKLNRTFPATAQFQQMATTLYADEKEALERLGLKLQ